MPQYRQPWLVVGAFLEAAQLPGHRREDGLGFRGSWGAGYGSGGGCSGGGGLRG